jgi:SAM-dependent methyltransferase
MSSMDWEQQYLSGETPWDKGAPAPGLVDFLDQPEREIAGKVIVPGCGLGHDVRLLAAAKAQPEVLGLDVSPSALEAARGFPLAAGERYAQGDWFGLPDQWLGAFDWVWEHTCFCAIDPSMREAYKESAYKVLRPGGRLLGVFYLDPYDDEHQPGGGPPHGVDEVDLVQQFTGDGRFSVEQKWCPQSAYPGREGKELMLQLRREE